MPTYYRFDHDKPRVGDQVHCWKKLEDLKGFVLMMRRQDPDARRMKIWEVKGPFVREDDGDAVVLVTSAKQIQL